MSSVYITTFLLATTLSQTTDAFMFTGGHSQGATRAGVRRTTTASFPAGTDSSSQRRAREGSGSAAKALSRDVFDTLYGIPSSSPLSSFFFDLDPLPSCRPASSETIPSPRFSSSNPASAMSLDITETPTEYIISADLPGLMKEDIKINVLPSNQLEISSERKAPEATGATIKRQERFYGTVTRRIALPEDADENSISASYLDGVLGLRIPKNLEKTRVKNIEISGLSERSKDPPPLSSSSSSSSSEAPSSDQGEAYKTIPNAALEEADE